MQRAWAVGIVVSALVVAGALGACGQSTDANDGGADASSGGDGSSADAASADGAGDDGSTTDGGFDVGPVFDAGPHPDAATPPVVACGDGGADASDPCMALPDSVCVDTTWLEFYFNGHCVAGTCQYDTDFHACEPQVEGMCVSGACEHPVLR